jgi:hypothetical protein
MKITNHLLKWVKKRFQAKHYWLKNNYGATKK